MRRKIFLLGGADLEMLTIKKILERQNEIIYDKKLRWDNAALSRYAEELKQYGNNEAYEIYGVELTEKQAAIPINYHRIDHHNDYSNLPSSLEQIASLLNIKLDREQQLIAANDRGYIPAMIAMEASGDEIRQIRLADRRAQGVTASDEQFAEDAVSDRIEANGIIIVKSATNSFSPITDRLYPYDRLLIYTADELIYYGTGKLRLVGIYKKEILEGKMFHGGGDSGFIGTVRSAYTEQEIITLKEEIIKQINT
ncbi:MAG: hypothetical protein LBV74_11010 [Tannerella sp.]|jgi:hypothetical protein|nr:hypothetical protein [Tannerella sp.]